MVRSPRVCLKIGSLLGSLVAWCLLPQMTDRPKTANDARTFVVVSFVVVPSGATIVVLCPNERTNDTHHSATTSIVCLEERSVIVFGRH